MSQLSTDDAVVSHRYALCVGIGQYTQLRNRNLRYAVKDATTIAERLRNSQRGSFATTLLIEPAQTSKTALDEALDELLNAPDRKAEDLVLIYFSCHGDVVRPDDIFCLLPSNATLQNDATFKKTTVIDIYDLTKLLSGAKARNIIVLLDVCHSGGAGVALQHLKLDLPSGPNLYIIGAARQDQVAMQSSQLEHGLFTHCLLRAFEQLPTKDGWLTISQIYSFISDDIQWFAKEHPIQIQGWSVSVNPNLPLLRNPAYPELCPLPPLWTVPLQRNSFFTGQEDLLARLATLLQSEQQTALTQPHALTGLGGIGKTQLALEYAYRHRQDYHAVLWSRADTREALISTFVTIAHLLDLPQKDEQDEMITVDAVKTWLVGRSNWLLVLDNADELAMVKEFIPPAFQGHLLLTTRAQVMGGLARKIEVEAMRLETGALLLLRRAGLIASDASLEQASPADVTVAKELSEEMGGLPLALDQAGAYIEETQCSLLGYQWLYQKERAALLQRRGGLNITYFEGNSPSRLRSFFRHLFQPSRALLQEPRGISVIDHPEPVATTWSLSFAKVKQANAAAADLLQFCAFLHPDAIPEELITKGAVHLGKRLRRTAAEPSKFNEAIEVLGRYSLVQRNPTTNVLTIHRLVQAVLRANMTDKTQHEWAERTVRAVHLTFPDVTDVKLWGQCERYLSHALVCATLIEDYFFEFAEASRLLDQTAYYLHERAQYPQAEPLYQQALAIREKRLGPQHPSTAQSLNDLALLYYAQGKYSLAEPLYQRALAIREQQLGSEHPETAQSLNNLAGLYDTQGKYSLAEPLYQRALAIREQQLGPEHPETATSLNNLAGLYWHQGQYEQAEPLHKRALSIREQQLGPEHPETATSLNNLALLYRAQGKYSLAEPLYQRALAIDEKAYGPDHPEVATDLSNLGALYCTQGKYAQAEPLLQRALTIVEKQLGLEHPETANCLNNLAELYRAQGQYAQAEPLLQRVLTIREQQLGPEHPEMATCLNNLAELYHAQGKYAQAEPLLQRALTIVEQQLGPEHSTTATVRENYNVLVGNMKRKRKRKR